MKYDKVEGGNIVYAEINDLCWSNMLSHKHYTVHTARAEEWENRDKATQYIQSDKSKAKQSSSKMCIKSKAGAGTLAGPSFSNFCSPDNDAFSEQNKFVQSTWIKFLISSHNNTTLFIY